MATVTFTIDPDLLEAAQNEAERRSMSLDEMLLEYLASVRHENERRVNAENLIRLMNEGVLGHIDRPMTREEIYAERTWPRS